MCVVPCDSCAGVSRRSRDREPQEDNDKTNKVGSREGRAEPQNAWEEKFKDLSHSLAGHTLDRERNAQTEAPRIKPDQSPCIIAAVVEPLGEAYVIHWI